MLLINYSKTDLLQILLPQVKLSTAIFHHFKLIFTLKSGKPNELHALSVQTRRVSSKLM